MIRTTRPAAWASLALFAAMACRQGPSPEVQARLDSLTTAASERDQLVAEMAQNARMLSEVSTDLAKVQVHGKLNVAGESPSQSARDTVVQKVRYIVSRLNETQTRLRDSERRINGLSQLSDSLKATLTATIANYDSVIAGQRATIAELTGQNTELMTANAALKDTLNDVSLRDNTVYYVIGTKDDLVRRGIIEETGGSRFLFILWKSGASLQPARNLDPSNFTAIDKRQVKTIALPDTSAAYQIASRQDLSALATPPDQSGKLRGRVEIASSDQFWRGSKFLILVQS